MKRHKSGSGERSPVGETWNPKWRSDPLSHPVLQSMSQEELADLPFEPRRFSDRRTDC